MAGRSSQGTTFTFASTTYTVTSVRFVAGASRRNVSAPHMGIGRDDYEPIFLVHRTADEESTVEIEFLGPSAPSVNATGGISLLGAFSVSAAVATCVSVQVTAAVGDLVRGTAGFRIRI